MVDVRLIHGSALHIPLDDESVQCVVTSPPYWGLRQYAGEQIVPEWGCALGLEPTPDLYVEHMVAIFREVRRVLRRDGTLWLNLGDSYNNRTRERGSSHQPGLNGISDEPWAERAARGGVRMSLNSGGMKEKDLVGIPWMVAFALRADGWYLRSDIIWHKCLSAGTRLYARTPRSEGPATLHDLVRLDPSTVQLWNGERWTQVVSWQRQRSSTARLTLRSGERITASPEHRWLLADGRLVETRDLKVGDVLATTALPEPEHPSDEGLPSDLAWFAGLYLAEGSRSDDAIQIAGHADEVARHERVFEIAERYGGTATLHSGPGSSVSVVVHGAFLDAALRHFVAGRTALDKHAHPRAWRSSNATLRAFVEGYLAGDGSRDAANDRWRLGFGNNPQWADSLRTLAARLGATLTLSPSLARVGRTRTFEAYRGEWRWTRSGHGNERERAEVVAVEQRREADVWDVAVADDPHTFALASGVLTHNSNPMPESVTDRPTKAHEYLFLLTKSERYYYDADAIREPNANPDLAEAIVDWRERPSNGEWPSGTGGRMGSVQNGRNKRTVWTIATRPYKGAHFATFPPDLVEPCVLAGSSPKACGVCGAPWERVMERTDIEDASAKGSTFDGGKTGARYGGDRTQHGPRTLKVSVGWRSTCDHDDDSGACVVLDPFNGSGTTGQVAVRLGRSYVGVDISKEYLDEQAVRRIYDVQMEAAL